MTVSRYKTAGEIVSAAARDLGIGSWNDPFASSDEIAERLCGYFNDCGEELLHAHKWMQLKTEWVFTTAPGDTGNYDLPGDWHEIVPQTGWNRTTRLPLGGPLSPQEWQYLKAVLSGVTVTVFARFETNQLRLFPQPVMPGIVVAMEYMSRSWIVPDAKKADWTTNHFNTLGADGADEATQSSDICLFDQQLIKLLLKLKWRENLGFDTTKDQDAYDRFLEKTKSSVDPAPTLSISEGSTLHFRLVDESNLPPTGYGQ